MKSIKTVYLALAIISIANAAMASSIEFDSTAGKIQTQLCIEKKISDRIGAFAYNCQTQNWGETYAGLTYAPTSNIQIAFGAGQETGGNRIGGWVWAGKGRFSLLYCAEDGFTGPWHKTVVKAAITNKLSFGYTEKSFSGCGLLVEYKLTKTTTIKYSGYKTPELALQLSF